MPALRTKTAPTSPVSAQSSSEGPVRFFRRWVAWTVLGESIGFAVAAAAGIAVAVGGLPPTAASAVLVAAGATEGALLGAGQALALRTLPLAVSVAGPWIALTSLAGMLAWAMGLVPSWLPGLDWSSPVVWLAAGVLGLVLLATIPTAELVVLRRIVRGPWRWLPANLIGWVVGISWTFAVSPLVDAATPVARLLALYLTAGVLMALTVASATGLCWLSRLRHAKLRPGSDAS